MSPHTSTQQVELTKSTHANSTFKHLFNIGYIHTFQENTSFPPTFTPTLSSLSPSISPLTLLPQLEMITDLLGAPSLEDVRHITSHTAIKSLLSKHKPPALQTLYTLAPSTSHGAVHLLSQMLVFNPVSTTPRWTADCEHYQYTLSVLDTKMTSEASDLIWAQYWSVW